MMRKGAVTVQGCGSESACPAAAKKTKSIKHI